MGELFLYHVHDRWQLRSQVLYYFPRYLCLCDQQHHLQLGCNRAISVTSKKSSSLPSSMLSVTPRPSGHRSHSLRARHHTIELLLVFGLTLRFILVRENKRLAMLDAENTIYLRLKWRNHAPWQLWRASMSRRLVLIKRDFGTLFDHHQDPRSLL